MTGGTDKESLVGIDQLLMVLCVTIYPQAHLDEIAAFIFNEGGALYSNSLLSKRLKELEITKKKVSTEAHQAFLPANQLRTHLFWTEPPPLGVHGVVRAQMNALIRIP